MRLDPSVKLPLTAVSSLHHKRRTPNPGSNRDWHEKPSICSTSFDQQYRKSAKRRNLSHNEETPEEQAYCAYRRQM